MQNCEPSVVNRMVPVNTKCDGYCGSYSAHQVNIFPAKLSTALRKSRTTTFISENKPGSSSLERITVSVQVPWLALLYLISRDEDQLCIRDLGRDTLG
jgi:hypothetical protein